MIIEDITVLLVSFGKDRLVYGYHHYEDVGRKITKYLNSGNSGNSFSHIVTPFNGELGEEVHTLLKTVKGENFHTPISTSSNYRSLQIECRKLNKECNKKEYYHILKNTLFQQFKMSNSH